MRKYNGTYSVIRQMAEDVEDGLAQDREHGVGFHNEGLRRHFVDLLRRVGDVTYLIEEVDDGDLPAGAENESLVRVHGLAHCARCGGELEAKVNPDGVFIVHMCATPKCRGHPQ